ncbi:MAG: hypothetical protein ACYS8W_19715 [Planctomycetota bacterium]|jgi:hypothetical protein
MKTATAGIETILFQVNVRIRLLVLYITGLLIVLAAASGVITYIINRALQETHTPYSSIVLLSIGLLLVWSSALPAVMNFFFAIREKWSIRVTEPGILLRTWTKSYMIPWEDVEKFGNFGKGGFRIYIKEAMVMEHNFHRWDLFGLRYAIDDKYFFAFPDWKRDVRADDLAAMLEDFREHFIAKQQLKSMES